MRIATNIVERLKEDAFMKSEIVRVTGKSYPTVLRWIYNNDEMLTLKAVVDVIKKNYLLKDQHLFSTEPEKQPLTY